MQMLFTSGTPEIPRRSWRTTCASTRVGRSALCLAGSAQDRLYTGLSLTHANAQLITPATLLTLGRARRDQPPLHQVAAVGHLPALRAAPRFNLLGGMTTAVYSETPRPTMRNNPVRMVLSAGMPAAIWEDFARRFGVAIFGVLRRGRGQA